RTADAPLDVAGDGRVVPAIKGGDGFRILGRLLDQLSFVAGRVCTSDVLTLLTMRIRFDDRHRSHLTCRIALVRCSEPFPHKKPRAAEKVPENRTFFRFVEMGSLPSDMKPRPQADRTHCCRDSYATLPTAVSITANLG